VNQIMKFATKSVLLFKYRKNLAEAFGANLYYFERKMVRFFEDLHGNHFGSGDEAREVRLQSYVIKNPIGSRNLLFFEMVINYVKLIDISMVGLIDWDR
jgi:hypothetical protein